MAFISPDLYTLLPGSTVQQRTLLDMELAYCMMILALVAPLHCMEECESGPEYVWALTFNIGMHNMYYICDPCKLTHETPIYKDFLRSPSGRFCFPCLDSGSNPMWQKDCQDKFGQFMLASPHCPAYASCAGEHILQCHSQYHWLVSEQGGCK